MQTNDWEAFQAPMSVWAELKAKLAPAEVQEVVGILGQSQIDRNDELHQELRTLLEILLEYTAEVDSKVQMWSARFSRDANRDMLTTEIRSFISALRSKTSTPISLRPSTPHDRAVLGYVLPEHEKEEMLAVHSARHLLASRGDGCRRGEGVIGRVSSNERPATAEVARQLASDITRKEGADVTSRKLSLEAMEKEAQRFQHVLAEEERELKEHIEFLHQVLDAEQDRDNLHSTLPTTTDLKDLRDKLQTELAFAAVEDRISKGSRGGACSFRLAPLAPLGQSNSANLLADTTLPGVHLRAATPLCPVQLPTQDAGGGGGGGGEGSKASSAVSASRSLLTSAVSASSADSGGSGARLHVDGGKSRPLSRCAAALGLDLDSDEDDFLFGDEEDAEHGLEGKGSRSQRADVLVLDDDDDVDAEGGVEGGGAGGGEQQGFGSGKARGSARVGSGAGGVRVAGEGVGRRGVAERGKWLVWKGTGKGEGEGEGDTPMVDVELEEQSKALRSLLSGLATRDTLADTSAAAEGFRGLGFRVDTLADTSAADEQECRASQQRCQHECLADTSAVADAAAAGLHGVNEHDGADKTRVGVHPPGVPLAARGVLQGEHRESEIAGKHRSCASAGGDGAGARVGGVRVGRAPVMAQAQGVSAAASGGEGEGGLGMAGGRRVSLGRHRSLIQEVRSSGGAERMGGAVAPQRGAGDGGGGGGGGGGRGGSAETRAGSGADTRGGASGVSGGSGEAAVMRARVALGARGPARGLVGRAGSATHSAARAGDAGLGIGAVGGEEGEGGGELLLSGITCAPGGQGRTQKQGEARSKEVSQKQGGLCPPTPPTAPRRPMAGEPRARLRPIYTRPSASHAGRLGGDGY